MKYLIGIDMGGTTTKIGLFTQDGELLGQDEIPSRVDLGQKVMFEDMAACVRKMTSERGIALADCAAGIGVAGPVENDGYVEVIVNLKMADLYPARELSKLLDGIPAAVSNDANVAALGEMWKGGGKGAESLLFITLGTGVGGGVVTGGKVVNGTHGMGGEIGHIFSDPEETELCNCGGRGCLEQSASATGIARNAVRFMQKYDIPSTLRSIEKPTAKDVFDAAKAGDELAVMIADHCMSSLGKVVAMITHVTDPEVVVIGGGVSKAGPYLADLVKKHYLEYIHLRKICPDFVIAQLGNDAGMYGAARLALDLI